MFVYLTKAWSQAADGSSMEGKSMTYIDSLKIIGNREENMFNWGDRVVFEVNFQKGIHQDLDN